MGASATKEDAAVAPTASSPTDVGVEAKAEAAVAAATASNDAATVVPAGLEQHDKLLRRLCGPESVSLGEKDAGFWTELLTLPDGFEAMPPERVRAALETYARMLCASPPPYLTHTHTHAHTLS